MTALTRRHDSKAPAETWRIYFGDIQAGTIAKNKGSIGSPAWQWFCGFYPGSHPGEQSVGTAASFAEARSAFESAWRAFVSRRSPGDFDEWRRHQAFTAWKYAMWDAGCRLPTQNTSGRSRCFCGAEIDLRTNEGHVYSTHMDTTQ